MEVLKSDFAVIDEEQRSISYEEANHAKVRDRAGNSECRQA